MQDNNTIKNLFASIDNKNVEEFTSFLDDNCCFRFGNLPALTGADEIGNFVSGFFDSIESLQHEISDFWSISSALFAMALSLIHVVTCRF